MNDFVVNVFALFYPVTNCLKAERVLFYRRGEFVQMTWRVKFELYKLQSVSRAHFGGLMTIG